MDVTDEASVENAYNQLKDDLSGTGLWALINNAGVLRAGPLEVFVFVLFSIILCSLGADSQLQCPSLAGTAAGRLEIATKC